MCDLLDWDVSIGGDGKGKTRPGLYIGGEGRGGDRERPVGGGRGTAGAAPPHPLVGRVVFAAPDGRWAHGCPRARVAGWKRRLISGIEAVWLVIGRSPRAV